MIDKKKPLLIYDGDCEFCSRWGDRWHFVTGSSVHYVPYQNVQDKFPNISAAEFIGAVQYIALDGSRSQGAEAVFHALAAHPNLRWLLRIYYSFPSLAKVSELLYRVVAENRVVLSRVNHMLCGPRLGRPTMILTRDIFLRGLGLIYAIAFASLGTQILGLVGSEGILPVEIFFNSLSKELGIERYWLYPSFFWLSANDGVLQFICLVGAIFGIALAFGVQMGLAFAFLWMLYLSLLTVCRDFMAFQWDTLLLETGFMAVFLAPKFYTFNIL